ncbi:MAG: hypothetical protein ABI460_05410 [Caldimonas sp.]
MALLTFALTACGPGSIEEFFCDDACAADYFATRTAVEVSPTPQDVTPGATLTANIVVAFANVRPPDSNTPNNYYTYALKSLTRRGTDQVGVATAIAILDSQPCAPLEVPPLIYDKDIPFTCVHARLSVTAAADITSVLDIPIEAQMTRSDYVPSTLTFNTSVLASTTDSVVSSSLRLRFVSGFDLAVDTTSKLFATGGTVPVSLTRLAPFAGPVDLKFYPLTSDVAASFDTTVIAAGSTSAQLRFDLPAHYAGGGFVPLRITGTNGALTVTRDFVQRIDPLYRVTLTPKVVTLTSLAPVEVDVAIDFDPAAPLPPGGAGRLDLELGFLQTGVTGTFTPPTPLVANGSPVTTLHTKLTLTTVGTFGGRDDTLDVRVTASDLPADASGVKPFVIAPLDLTVTPGLLWDFVANDVSYGVTQTDAIGLAMQSDDRPAIGWLEGNGIGRQVFVKRFDGTTFVPSPAAANGLLPISGGAIEQARMGMTTGDVAQVALTYRVGTQSGAGLALANVGTGAGATWSRSEYVGAGAGQHIRSPRIATRGDAIAFAYVMEEDAPVDTMSLFVRSAPLGGPPAPLPGALPGGALNAVVDGRVLPESPSLAQRSDGQPWVAWVEQPSDRNLEAALWLRSYDGTNWGFAVSAPTSRPTGEAASLRPLVDAPTQLLVEPSGAVVVAYLQGNPARLRVLRYDPAGLTWTALSNTGNGEGSLNLSTSEPARDMSLTRDAAGRLVIAWTEGPLAPRLVAKRQKADTSWELLGTPIDDTATTRSPFIASDRNSRLYVEWTHFFLGADLSSPAPRAAIVVARWIF